MGRRFWCVVSVNITINQDGAIADGGAALLTLNLADFLVREGRGRVGGQRGRAEGGLGGQFLGGYRVVFLV